MDSIERFLQIKIFGVDMIGIIGLAFIASLVFIFHKGKPTSRATQWKVPVACIVIGSFSLMLALGEFDRDAKGIYILKEWTRTEGVVTRMERLEVRGRRGRINYTNRATVSFSDSESRRREGLLFHEEHAEGSRITIMALQETEWVNW